MRIAALLLAAILASAQDPAQQDEVQVHFDRALQFSIDGKDADAIPEYRAVLALEPDLYEAHINLGQVLLRSKQPAEALPHLRRARDLKPSEFGPTYYLAEALTDLAQFREAVPVYAAAAALDPKSAPAELGWGRGLLKLDQRTLATEHYRKAAALDPLLKQFLLELAQAHEEKKEYDAAIALYRDFPENAPITAHIAELARHNELTRVQDLVQAKKLPEAEPIAARLAAADPQNFELKLFYARILRDQRKTKAAAQQFYEATKLHPLDAQAWSEFAAMLILDEQYPQALLALDKVKELGGEGAGHIFFRATTFDRLNRKKEALEYYQRFLDQSRTNPDQEFQARQRIRLLERETGKR
jgi:tetratricopeptide (TPR) repeat protein